MTIGVKYESFDVNSTDNAFNKPNAEIVLSSDVRSVEIIATDNNGEECRKKLVLDESGKNWVTSD